jgi:8-oxo-dGTP pyrophosphatase MutT (NUDIX family)
MEESEFLKLFKEELVHHLPGEKAHLRMSPSNRPISSSALKNAIEVRDSAVAIVIFKKDNQLECILTQRADYEGNHGGQVSFPGGKKDPDDANLEETARRECYEEIGISLHSGILLGQLTDVFIPVSGFLVKPFVYYHTELPQFIKNEREVAEILTFPLFDLKKEDLISSMEIRLPNGTIYKDIPYFNLSDKKVWGATALILNELREILLELD